MKRILLFVGVLGSLSLLALGLKETDPNSAHAISDPADTDLDADILLSLPAATLENSLLPVKAMGGSPAMSNIDTSGVSGQSRDPTNPQTWAVQGAVAVSVGREMDPDNPETWISEDQNLVVSVGQEMNPDDPLTWTSVHDVAAPLSVGVELDPSSPWTWPTPWESGAISVGVDLDPVDPAYWP